MHRLALVVITFVLTSIFAVHAQQNTTTTTDTPTGTAMSSTTFNAAIFCSNACNQLDSGFMGTQFKEMQTILGPHGGKAHWIDTTHSAEKQRDRVVSDIATFIIRNSIRHVFVSAPTISVALEVAKNASLPANVHFACIDYPTNPIPGELSHRFEVVAFREDQAGFLAGVLAGAQTRSGVVGVVSGPSYPALRSFTAGFSSGVFAVCPSCVVASVYMSSFNNSTEAKLLAQSMTRREADVIWGVGGKAGSAAIYDVAGDSVFVIGVDTDEFYHAFAGKNDSKTQHLLSSAVKRVDTAVRLSLTDHLAGTPSTGVRTLKLTDGGVGLAPCHNSCDNYSPKTRDALRYFSEGLKSGVLTTHVSPISGNRLVPGPATRFHKVHYLTTTLHFLRTQAVANDKLFFLDAQWTRVGMYEYHAQTFIKHRAQEWIPGEAPQKPREKFATAAVEVRKGRHVVVMFGGCFLSGDGGGDGGGSGSGRSNRNKVQQQIPLVDSSAWIVGTATTRGDRSTFPFFFRKALRLSTEAPPSRIGHTLVAHGQNVFLYGGADATGTSLNDFWVGTVAEGYSSSNPANLTISWKKLPSPTFESGRTGHTGMLWEHARVASTAATTTANGRGDNSGVNITTAPAIVFVGGHHQNLGQIEPPGTSFTFAIKYQLQPSTSTTTATTEGAWEPMPLGSLRVHTHRSLDGSNVETVDYDHTQIRNVILSRGSPCLFPINKQLIVIVGGVRSQRPKNTALSSLNAEEKLQTASLLYWYPERQSISVYAAPAELSVADGNDIALAAAAAVSSASVAASLFEAPNAEMSCGCITATKEFTLETETESTNSMPHHSLFFAIVRNISHYTSTRTDTVVVGQPSNTSGWFPIVRSGTRYRHDMKIFDVPAIQCDRSASSLVTSDDNTRCVVCETSITDNGQCLPSPSSVASARNITTVVTVVVFLCGVGFGFVLWFMFLSAPSPLAAAPRKTPCALGYVVLENTTRFWRAQPHKMGPMMAKYTEAMHSKLAAKYGVYGFRAVGDGGLLLAATRATSLLDMCTELQTHREEMCLTLFGVDVTAPSSTVEADATTASSSATKRCEAGFSSDHGCPRLRIGCHFGSPEILFHRDRYEYLGPDVTHVLALGQHADPSQCVFSLRFANAAYSEREVEQQKQQKQQQQQQQKYASSTTTSTPTATTVQLPGGRSEGTAFSAAATATPISPEQETEDSSVQLKMPRWQRRGPKSEHIAGIAGLPQPIYRVHAEMLTVSTSPPSPNPKGDASPTTPTTQDKQDKHAGEEDGGIGDEDDNDEEEETTAQAAAAAAAPGDNSPSAPSTSSGTGTGNQQQSSSNNSSGGGTATTQGKDPRLSLASTSTPEDELGEDPSSPHQLAAAATARLIAATPSPIPFTIPLVNPTRHPAVEWELMTANECRAVMDLIGRIIHAVLLPMPRGDARKVVERLCTVLKISTTREGSVSSPNTSTSPNNSMSAPSSTTAAAATEVSAGQTNAATTAVPVNSNNNNASATPSVLTDTRKAGTAPRSKDNKQQQQGGGKRAAIGGKGGSGGTAALAGVGQRMDDDELIARIAFNLLLAMDIAEVKRTIMMKF